MKTKKSDREKKTVAQCPNRARGATTSVTTRKVGKVGNGKKLWTTLAIVGVAAFDVRVWRSYEEKPREFMIIKAYENGADNK